MRIWVFCLLLGVPAHGVAANSSTSVATELWDFSILRSKLVYSTDGIRLYSVLSSNAHTLIESFVVKSRFFAAGTIRPGGLISLSASPFSSWRNATAAPLYRVTTGNGKLQSFPFGLEVSPVPDMLRLFAFTDTQWTGYGADLQFHLPGRRWMGINIMHSIFQEERTNTDWFFEQAFELIDDGTRGSSVHIIWSYRRSNPLGETLLGLISSSSIHGRPGFFGFGSITVAVSHVKAEASVSWASRAYRSPRFDPVNTTIAWNSALDYAVSPKIRLNGYHQIIFQHLPLFEVPFRETQEDFGLRLRGEFATFKVDAEWKSRIESNRFGTFSVEHELKTKGVFLLDNGKIGIWGRGSVQQANSIAEPLSISVGFPLEIEIDSLSFVLQPAVLLECAASFEVEIRLRVPTIRGTTWQFSLKPVRWVALSRDGVRELSSDPFRFLEFRIGWTYRTTEHQSQLPTDITSRSSRYP